jgi:quinolinate synthase
MNALIDEIKKLKRQHDAVILAHTYQPGEVQDCADYVGDSYGLSVEATRTTASVIVFAGVRFMAETAAILNPDRPVILPEPLAGCPMAEMITPAELAELKKKHPDHLVMCYVNSSAGIKALSDVCCTSSNALKIAQRLPVGKGIIFVPDRHLGSWVEEQTGREMVLWDGFCPTHLRITSEMITDAKRLHPEAEVLIHPEAPHECRVLCDAVLSTGGMCTHVKKKDGKNFIIATELGLIHTLRVNNPGKTFYPVSHEVICPNMKRGSLQSVRDALAGDGGEEVKVDKMVAEKALKSLERMLDLSK